MDPFHPISIHPCNGKNNNAAVQGHTEDSHCCLRQETEANAMESVT